MITGCLQQKNGFYYAVLYLKVNGRRRCKWVPMRLPVEGTSARKAQKAFDEIRLQYEREEEERLDREAKAKELAENTHPDALLLLPSTWKSGFNRPAVHSQRQPTKATLT